MILYAIALCLTVLLVYLLNVLSYGFLKARIIKKSIWDLNICCGKTDGGGLNVDIVKHDAELPNFKLVDNIYQLPFTNAQFDSILCSHTIEHVDDPLRFDQELRRVGLHVCYIVPPLWDVAAVLNFWEHRWVFLTLRKQHLSLPYHFKLPFSRTVQKHLEQRIGA